MADGKEMSVRKKASKRAPKKKAVKKGGLSAKYLLFIAGYITHFNATRAAEEAGYSPKGAHVTGHRLLRNAKVLKVIEEESEKALEGGRNQLQLRIKNELGQLGFSKVSDYLTKDSKNIDPIKFAETNPGAIREITVETRTDREGASTSITKFKLHGKEKALETLGKITGLINNKIQIEDVTDYNILIREAGDENIKRDD